MLTPSCRKASEHTAAAALTELRNNTNNKHHPPPQQQKQQQQQSSLVTSILSKNHINHLEANSVSVIPIGTKISTTTTNVVNSVNTRTKAAIAQQQLQQQLETAAVLMDISKKVIISPPSSNPQSPSLDQTNQQQQQPQSITSTVINLKRSKSYEEMDLSVKRSKSEMAERLASGGIVTVTTTTTAQPTVIPPITVRKTFPTADLTVIKRETPDNDELSHDSDDSNDSSDPGRLQMDISSQEALDIDDAKTKYGFNNRQMIDLGRETPDSMKSDDHGTDPATTQLWQALARTTGMCGGFFVFFCCCCCEISIFVSLSVNGGGNEATQLLRQMINCRSLGLPIPSSLSISSARSADQPMSLIKVCVQIVMFLYDFIVFLIVSNTRSNI